jgi:hypothetical protein
MSQEYSPQESYYSIIKYIAKSKRKDANLYNKAKLYLKQLNPGWNDVKLETYVLWDVRQYFVNSTKN